MTTRPRFFPTIPQPIPGKLESVVAAADALKRWIEALGGMVGPAGSPYHAVTFASVSPALLQPNPIPGLPPIIALPPPGSPGNHTGLTSAQVLARISLEVVQG